ncbi:MAG TPA: electron transport complex subunit RsxC [Thermoanaerobaculia bacterium]
MTVALGPSFRHGVHPAEHKEATAHLPIERMPFVRRYVLPLGQHIGAPSVPVVRVGQEVERGELLAKAGGFVSASLHSPVRGRVTAIGPQPHPQGRLAPAIVVSADPFADQRLPEGEAVDWRAMPVDDFVAEVQAGGLVGMGGAAFPTHVKYRTAEGKPIERLVLNGCECEPFLTADHRLMVEQPESVVRGALIAAARLGAREIVIGVELNKPDAIAALGAAVPEDAPVRVVGLRVKYPQGAEKMLIRALFGLEVPSGKLPLDVGIVVNNVATVAAMADWLLHRRPLVERIVTVSGPGVRRPANLLVPIGTPVREVLEHCGGLLPDTRELVMGGPMMGAPLASLDVPVMKGTSGLLAFTAAEARLPHEYTCIRCGRCVDACPQLLNPSRLAKLARAGRWEEMERWFVADCVECGSCSFACPSGIPIVQLIRVAKSALRDQKAKAS